MSKRIGYFLAVILLLIGAGLRLYQLPTLPPGFSNDEVDTLLITETARAGSVRVFYNLRGEGHEGLYPAILAASTSMTGGGLLGYRIISVLAGLLSLAMIYALGQRLFGTAAALAAVALSAVSLFPVLLSRGVTRETLLPFYISGTLLTLARALPIYGIQEAREPRTTTFAALATLLGLGFYLHPISLVFSLAMMVFIAYMLLTRQPISRRALSSLWFAVVVMIVLATPYVIASFGTPDLAGAGRLLYDSSDSPRQMSLIESLTRGLGGVFLSGDNDPLFNLPGRPMIDVVSGLLLLIGVVTAVRYWRQPRCALLLISVIFLLPLAVFARRSPNFLAFSALLPVLALLYGLGVVTLYHSLQKRTRFVVIIAVAGITVFNIVWTGGSLFNEWRDHPQVRDSYNARLGELAHHIDVTSTDISTVVCDPAVGSIDLRNTLNDTQIMFLMMHRQNAPIRAINCELALILPNGGEYMQVIQPNPRGTIDVSPFLQHWYDTGLPPSEDLPDGAIPIEMVAALADQIGAFTTTAPLSFAPESPGGEQVTAPPVRMGANLTFLGYEQTVNEVYHPGDIVPVITYWRIDGLLPPDLQMFVHVLSDPTVIAVQWDNISAIPAQLQPRDVLIQVSYMQLPYQMPESNYRISVGAYTETDDNRILIYDGDSPRGTRLFLGQITVQRTG